MTILTPRRRKAKVAQPVEHTVEGGGVGGSTPSLGTKNCDSCNFWFPTLGSNAGQGMCNSMKSEFGWSSAHDVCEHWEQLE